MIACFDVHYEAETANAAAILFDRWSDEASVEQFSLSVADVGDYAAGSFYQRELKPLQVLLETIPRSIQYYVIDAYCHLSADRSPGLGAYLHDALPQGSIVIGVAKSRFRDTTHAKEIRRGDSARPLFVTAIGIEYQLAAEYVKSMAGAHRIPTMLKAVDRLARAKRVRSSSHDRNN